MATDSPNTPQRVQLSRRKAFRMPPNTVKVDRSTKWGNPFVPGSAKNPLGLPVKDKRHAFVLYRSVAADNKNLVEMARAELRGKNLACWCQFGDPYPDQDSCHAAVLLENRQWLNRTSADRARCEPPKGRRG